MNFVDQLMESLSKGNIPNNFTIGMGALIRQAREEKGYSQRQLSSLINRRQAALSGMENGLMQPDAETLLGLSLVLDKPIAYFFPKPYKPASVDCLTDEEKEVLFFVRKLNKEDLLKITAQIKALYSLYKEGE